MSPTQVTQFLYTLRKAFRELEVRKEIRFKNRGKRCRVTKQNRRFQFQPLLL